MHAWLNNDGNLLKKSWLSFLKDKVIRRKKLDLFQMKDKVTRRTKLDS
jgi:hypothetical protein